MEEVNRLIGRQKAEFNFVSNRQTWVLRVQLCIGMLIAAGIFVTNDTANYLLGLLVSLLAMAWLWLAQRVSSSRSHAERLRRTTLIAGGLGLPVGGPEAFSLATGGFASEGEAIRLVDPNYFASAKPPGVARLREMLSESASWTTTLSRFAGYETVFLFIIAAILVFASLFSILAFMSFDRWALLSRVGFVIVGVVASVDFLGSSISYFVASAACKAVIDRLGSSDYPDDDLSRLLIPLADYNSAVEAMPLLPPGIYNRHRTRLNEQYKFYLTGAQ